jgi:hypothetical protein
VRKLDVRPPSSGGGGGTPSDSVTGPDAFGDDAAPGTSLEYSRGDHNHGLPEGGSVASLSGAGTTESPGLLDQNGGLNVDDQEGDGITLSTNSNLEMTAAFSRLSSLQYVVEIQSGGNGGSVAIGSQAPSASFIVAPLGAVILPLTITEGVNDTFVFTPIGTGIPDTYTIAPGTYDGITDVANAMGGALDSSSSPFSAVVENVQQFGSVDELTVLSNDPPGDILSSGPTDALASLGFNPSNTLTEGLTDLLTFFAGGGGVVQQTVTGALSTVVDPAAKAVLTSIIAALGGYGLFIDGTT